MQVESNRIELNWLCDRSMCRFVDLSTCRLVYLSIALAIQVGRGRHMLGCPMPHAACCCSCQLRAQLSNVPINNMRKFPNSLSLSVSF